LFSGFEVVPGGGIFSVFIAIIYEAMGLFSFTMFIGFFRISVPLFRRGLPPEVTALTGTASPQRLDMAETILTDGLSRRDQSGRE
jgi:hypothetical protein